MSYIRRGVGRFNVAVQNRAYEPYVPRGGRGRPPGRGNNIVLPIEGVEPDAVPRRGRGRPPGRGNNFVLPIVGVEPDAVPRRGRGRPPGRGNVVVPVRNVEPYVVPRRDRGRPSQRNGRGDVRIIRVHDPDRIELDIQRVVQQEYRDGLPQGQVDLFRARNSQNRQVARERLPVDRQVEIQDQNAEGHRVAYANARGGGGGGARGRRNRTFLAGVLGDDGKLRYDIPEEDYLGPLNELCTNCRAKHFHDERLRNPRNEPYSDCCDKGNVNIMRYHLLPFPPELQALYENSRNPDASEEEKLESNGFNRLIRQYNNAMATASLSYKKANILTPGPYLFKVNGMVYHHVFNINELERGELSRYNQTYIFDTAVQNDHRHQRNETLNENTLDKLKNILSNSNAMYNDLRNMYDVGRHLPEQKIVFAPTEHFEQIQEENVRGWARGRGAGRGGGRAGGGRRRDRFEHRRFDLPVAREIVGVLSEDMVSDLDRGVCVYMRRNNEKKFFNYDQGVCDPMTYPLLFPQGEVGWDKSLRNIVSPMHFYSFLLSIRDEFNPILHGKDLFQQYIVDCYTKLLRDRLAFIEKNQLEIWAEELAVLQGMANNEGQFNAVNDLRNRANGEIDRRNNANNANPGNRRGNRGRGNRGRGRGGSQNRGRGGSQNRVRRTHNLRIRNLQNQALEDIRNAVGTRISILPATFPESPRNRRLLYNDAMAIIAKFGKPDLFITFTCNTNWREIVENLYPGQTASDRPDLVAKVFDLKARRFIEEIYKGGVFGKCLSYVGVVEFQKRGLPHLHLLVTLAPEYKLNTPAKVDAVINAELPDINGDAEERLFHGHVTKFMLHSMCGTVNPSALCMRNLHRNRTAQNQAMHAQRDQPVQNVQNANALDDSDSDDDVSMSEGDESDDNENDSEDAMSESGSDVDESEGDESDADEMDDHSSEGAISDHDSDSTEIVGDLEDGAESDENGDMGIEDLLGVPAGSGSGRIVLDDDDEENERGYERDEDPQLDDDDDDDLYEQSLSHENVNAAVDNVQPGVAANPDVCKKRFPKPFTEETNISNKFPVYRRRNNGRIFSKMERRNMINYTNQWVVPTNKYLITRFNAHINVELCALSSKCCKYLYNYIHKGSDMADIGFARDNRDEIKSYMQGKYIAPCEAAYRIFSLKTHFTSHSVTRLDVHLPGHQRVYWNEGQEQGRARNNRVSTLMSWFELNRRSREIFENDERVRNEDYRVAHRFTDASGVDRVAEFDLNIDSRNFYYHEIPEKFTYVKASGGQSYWKPRQARFNVVGRVFTINISKAGQEERYYLRMLLLHTKGAESFDHLKTVIGHNNDQPFDTFKGAAMARGLLIDDFEHKNCLQEASEKCTPAQVRYLYAFMLSLGTVADPAGLYNQFKRAMWEDYTLENHPHRQGLSEEEAEMFLYRDLVRLSRIFDFDFTNIRGIDRPANLGDDLNVEEYLDRRQLLTDGTRNRASLNREQSTAFDAIYNRVNAIGRVDNNCFSLDGPAGTGKTFVYKTLYQQLSGEGKNVLCVASSGIAASLLPNGRTAHSAFKLKFNMTPDDYLTTMKMQSALAEELRNVDLVIWDEISMTPHWALKSVDKLFRDLTGQDVPFGGKVFVFGGDFRQIVPVIKGPKREAIFACPKNFAYWQSFTKFRLTVNQRTNNEEFREFLMKIGNGLIGREMFNGEREIEIPGGYLSSSNEIVDFVKEIYDDNIILNPDQQYLDDDPITKVCILTPHCRTAAAINEMVLDMMPGEMRTYFSQDKVALDRIEQMNLVSAEHMNRENPSGFPPHELRLKKGSIVMLLRNISISEGLTNGTRMRVINFHDRSIECKIITSGNRANGEVVLIPRISFHLNPEDTGLDYAFTRIQFPVTLAFAMTIHKSQGQTFEKVGVFLESPVFQHGQLYVAFSRVRDPTNLKVYIASDNVHESRRNKTVNIVWPEILFDNIPVVEDNVE